MGKGSHYVAQEGCARRGTTCVNMVQCSFHVFSSQAQGNVHMLYLDRNLDGLCMERCVFSGFSMNHNMNVADGGILNRNRLWGVYNVSKGAHLMMEKCELHSCSALVCLNHAKLCMKNSKIVSGNKVFARPMSCLSLCDGVFDYQNGLFESILQTCVYAPDRGPAAELANVFKAFVIELENVTLVFPETFSSSVDMTFPLLWLHEDQCDGVGGKAFIDRTPQALMSLKGKLAIEFAGFPLDDACNGGGGIQVIDTQKVAHDKLVALHRMGFYLIGGRNNVSNDTNKQGGEMGSSWTRLFLSVGNQTVINCLSSLLAKSGKKVEDEDRVRAWFRLYSKEALYALPFEVQGLTSQYYTCEKSKCNLDIVKEMLLRPKWNSFENFMFVRNESVFLKLKAGVYLCDKLLLQQQEEIVVEMEEDVICTTPVKLGFSSASSVSIVKSKKVEKVSMVVCGGCCHIPRSDANKATNECFLYNTGSCRVNMQDVDVHIISKREANESLWVLPATKMDAQSLLCGTKIFSFLETKSVVGTCVNDVMEAKFERCSFVCFQNEPSLHVEGVPNMHINIVCDGYEQQQAASTSTVHATFVQCIFEREMNVGLVPHTFAEESTSSTSSLEEGCVSGRPSKRQCTSTQGNSPSSFVSVCFMGKTRNGHRANHRNRAVFIQCKHICKIPSVGWEWASGSVVCNLLN